MNKKTDPTIEENSPRIYQKEHEIIVEIPMKKVKTTKSFNVLKD